jgi:hypothetical protein
VQGVSSNTLDSTVIVACKVSEPESGRKTSQWRISMVWDVRV